MVYVMRDWDSKRKQWSCNSTVFQVANHENEGKERHQIKACLMKKRIAVYVRYKSMYTSLPSSAKQDNNNNNKIFITVSMYLAHRANWGHLLLQN